MLLAVAITLSLALGAAAGFLVAWLRRREALARSATYARSLEQLVSGTARDRDAAVERERARANSALARDQEQAQRLAELERELQHRELQVVTLREEAIQLARTREELGQRLARREQSMQQLEARNRELEQQEGGRPPGVRFTNPDREWAALVAAHEDDLAQVEARYLDEARAREAELDGLRQRLQALEATVAEHGDGDAQLADARARIAQLEPLAGRLAATEARARELEQRLRDAEARLGVAVSRGGDGPPDPALAGSGSTAVTSDREPDTPVTRKDPAASPVPEPVPAVPAKEALGGTAPRPGPRRHRHRQSDDLKQIQGITPEVERALNQLGITRFRQIARWKDKDIVRMAKKLDEVPDRIRRDDWVEGARREHRLKYGADP